MKLSLCNEVIRDLDFPAQCVFAAEVGYDGLEVAPFTLEDNPHLMPARRRAKVRKAVADAGISITGLHWLLVTPAGMTLNGRDEAARQRTVDVMRRLVDLCADLGGKVLVHGSPAQRTVADDDDPEAAWARARDSFAAVAEKAEAAGVTYCVEALARRETNFINTIAEAVAMVETIGSPALRTMIDCSAAAQTEDEGIPALLERWVPAGMVRHIQVNDANRQGPGQGNVTFADVFAALHRVGYNGVVAVEPFDYRPDGPACAARAIGYLRGIEEAIG
jgi:D-psicose/D-tagatose/L-ribulose 3-epimerase